ncbi:hypothetical protein [Candidatus Contubernalis alkaliaceticus]|uniref:hypothetical protein n=1 Tax=Candidatus Contubernalis alkaliaceticus TaxID=338645 RepID=UPI001F4BF3B0|nr:hypothetical protein [Candidatus Contubernalis alkalaceticus]
MKPKGLSVHLAAAYVIARRRMGFSEKVPPVLSGLLPEKIAVRHHWTHWSYITRMLKDVKPQALYQELGNMENVGSLKDLRNRLELTGEGEYLIPFSA